MYLNICLMGLELETEARSHYPHITLTFGTRLSLHAALSSPFRGESWIHAGWDQGVKGTIAARLFWLYVEASIPTLRQKYLKEDRGNLATESLCGELHG